MIEDAALPSSCCGSARNGTPPQSKSPSQAPTMPRADARSAVRQCQSSTRSRSACSSAHEPPHGAAAALGPRFADAGSPDVANLIARRRPALHFCGPYHEPGARLATTDAQSYQLDAVAAEPAGLAPGCIAIVTWRDATDHAVELLEAPWLRAFGRHSWRHAR